MITKYKGFILFLTGIFFVLVFNWGLDYSSTNEFCEGCHIHPQASQSWRMGNHFDNKSGVVVNCVDCHLPPGGTAYLMAKTSTGLRDVLGMIFEDTEKINWEMKSTREVASEHVYKASCIQCHQNLFPITLSKKGSEAHLYYDQKSDILRCINCHLETGHFHLQKSIPEDMFFTDDKSKELYQHPAVLDTFENFKEMIPGTPADFEMIVIPGGEFIIGSPESEAYREGDEGPQKKIRIDPF